MSNTQAPPASEKKENPLIPKLKDAAIFIGWIGGLILIAGLAWFFTQPLRSRLLHRAVNRALEQSDNSFRLGEPVSPRLTRAGLGSSFSMADISGRRSFFGSRVFVFTFVGEGFFFPCAAVLGPDGRVQEFIPLTSYGRRMMSRTSPEILRIHARRIEGAER